MPIESRPTGRKGYDVKCPDGFVTNGWRRICKDGYVNFQYERRYAPEFLGWAGYYVFMEITDCYAIDAHCWDDTPFRGDPFGTYSQKEWDALEPEDRLPIERPPPPISVRTR